jgi:hypothetical protein
LQLGSCYEVGQLRFGWLKKKKSRKRNKCRRRSERNGTKKEGSKGGRDLRRRKG